VSIRQNVRSAKRPFGKTSVGKMSVRQNVFRQNVFRQSVFRQNVRPPLPTDVVVITSNPRRRRLGLDLSIENTANAEMDQTVSVFLILGYFYK
jgi:hypothetical protein